MGIRSERRARGRFAELVPADFVAASALYELCFRSGAYSTWRTRGRVLSIEDFGRLLVGDSVASFAVVDSRHNGQLVGHVGLIFHDEASRVASVSAFFDLGYRDVKIIAGDALQQLAAYAFDVLGLRKLVIEAPAGVSSPLHESERWSDVLRHEGTLRSHVMIAGDFQDVSLFAVFADDFRARAAELDDLDLAGTPWEVVQTVLQDIADLPADVALDGGVRLVEDLGLDSLAIVEVVDRLEAAGLEAQSLEPIHENLSVHDLVSALERSAAGSTV